MAVEGLGKYTAIASGIFMTMVFGCAVMVPLQGWIADITGNYMSSYLNKADGFQDGPADAAPIKPILK